MSEDNKDKKFVAITGINTKIDCSDNEIEVYYNVMTRDEAIERSNPYTRHHGSNKTQVLTNKIKLENPDPRLLYTIFQLIGRLGYSVIELKHEDGLGEEDFK